MKRIGSLHINLVKAVKRLSQVDGSKTFEAVFTGTNEYEEIVVQNFVQSTAHQFCEEPIRQLVKSMEAFGQAPIHLVYTDKCCSDRPFFEEQIECLKDNLREIPLLELGDNEFIVASTSHHATILAEDALRDVRRQLARDGEATIGLDTEWDIGPPRSKIRMLQIATSGM